MHRRDRVKAAMSRPSDYQTLCTILEILQALLNAPIYIIVITDLARPTSLQESFVVGCSQ